MNSKFVLWKPSYYTFDWKKSLRKFTFLKHSFFWKRTVTVNLKKLSSNTIFRWYTFGKFYNIKFNYFSGGARGFEIFFIELFAVDIENKNITVKYLINSWISVTNPILSRSVHTGCYIYNSLVHIIYVLFICI